MPEILYKFVFRILPIENLVFDLRDGLFSKNKAPVNPQRSIIGNEEIIRERDNRIVTCYPKTVVNDYVPFYFSNRTPMLYNIITGMGVQKRNQEDIVYLCIPLKELMCNRFQWCFTDGNAAKSITAFYNRLDDLCRIDKKSINSNDFRMINADGDVDRIRKKHAEFLVRDHVPVDLIREIVVFNEKMKKEVEKMLKSLNLEEQIKVKVDIDYYF